MKGTLYIVPAWSDVAGQCRIVAYPGTDYPGKSARDSYAEHPELWKDAGLMNSRGELVSLDAKYSKAGGWQMLKVCEPLMATLEFEVDMFEKEIV